MNRVISGIINEVFKGERNKRKRRGKEERVGRGTKEPPAKKQLGKMVCIIYLSRDSMFINSYIKQGFLPLTSIISF